MGLCAFAIDNRKDIALLKSKEHVYSRMDAVGAHRDEMSSQLERKTHESFFTRGI